MKPSIHSFLLTTLLALLCLASGVVPTEAQNQLKLATQDFPPFSYFSESHTQGAAKQVAGPAAEIIRKVCEESNIQCTLTLLPWRRAQYDMRENGLHHGLFLIGKNKRRMEYLHFSPPVLKTEYGFFVMEDNPLKYGESLDIKDYRVAVYGPSNTSKSLEKIQNETKTFTIDMRPDDVSGFKKLSIGRVEAVYSNKDVGFAIIKKYGIKNIRYAGFHRELNYYIGFSQKHADKTVVDEFNSAFLKLYQQQVIHRILEKYQMEPAVINNIVLP